MSREQRKTKWVVRYKLRGHKEEYATDDFDNKRAADEMEDTLRQHYGRLLEWAKVEEE